MPAARLCYHRRWGRRTRPRRARGDRGQHDLLRALETGEGIQTLLRQHRIDQDPGRLDVVRAHQRADALAHRGSVMDASQDLEHQRARTSACLPSACSYLLVLQRA
jgi:hypothetical protein